MRSWLIRGARIVDGAGSPWFRGVALVCGGRIVAIGPGLDAPADAEIVEADHRYLASGFIDAHTHDDLSFLRDRSRVEKVAQGVSTVVVGNCSFSLYPAIGASREALRGHFASLLGGAAVDEIFDNFHDYRERLHAPGVAANVVSLVGHAALRLAVVGFDQRPAKAEEIAAMAALLDRQLADGAAGLSLGLVYPPSAHADRAELVALARAVAARGGVLAAHVRSYEAGLLTSIEEFVDLLRASGAACLLSHLQSAGGPNWGQVPRALEALENARREGVDISFDMYPYLAGSTYLLQLLPAAALDGGIGKLRERLREPAARSALRERMEGGGDAYAGLSKAALVGWRNIRISGVNAPALKPLEGLDMQTAAERAGLQPFDLLSRLIAEDEGQTSIILFQLSEDDLRAACCHRLHMFGSDGLPRPGTKPHPRALGCFPRALGPLRRDKGWFPLEDAVRRMTSVAAQRFGLSDRGLVRPGFAADLTLFDDEIEDAATFEEPTLLPRGVRSVRVNGELVWDAGAPTGLLPGRVVTSPRRAQ